MIATRWAVNQPQPRGRPHRKCTTDFQSVDAPLLGDGLEVRRTRSSDGREVRRAVLALNHPF